MKHDNLKDKETYLNEFYSDVYSEEEALNDFIYLTSPMRGKRTTESHILKCHRECRLGSLLRRLDPIAFNLA